MKKPCSRFNRPCRIKHDLTTGHIYTVNISPRDSVGNPGPKYETTWRLEPLLICVAKRENVHRWLAVMTKSTVYTADVHTNVTPRPLQSVDSTLTLSHYFDVFRNNRVAISMRKRINNIVSCTHRQYVFFSFCCGLLLVRLVSLGCQLSQQLVITWWPWRWRLECTAAYSNLFQFLHTQISLNDGYNETKDLTLRNASQAPRQVQKTATSVMRNCLVQCATTGSENPLLKSSTRLHVRFMSLVWTL